MSRPLQIDRDTGHVRLAQCLIAPAIRPSELDAGFTLGDSRPVMVGDRQVDCRFAYLALQEGRLHIELSLRFEAETLVSLFIALSDPAISTGTDDDFYASILQRERLHRGWLTAQLGERNDFPWGSAGVARDKSENVFIYLHNHNNRWVFGD